MFHALTVLFAAFCWFLIGSPKHAYYKIVEIRSYLLMSLLAGMVYFCIVFAEEIDLKPIMLSLFFVHFMYLLIPLYNLCANYTQEISNAITLSIYFLTVWLLLFVCILDAFDLIIDVLESSVIIMISFAILISLVLLLRFSQLGNRSTNYGICLKVCYIVFYVVYFVLWSCVALTGLFESIPIDSTLSTGQETVILAIQIIDALFMVYYVLLAIKT
jgi:hypothetical protein